MQGIDISWARGVVHRNLDPEILGDWVEDVIVSPT
jgi:hypothetical protein